MKKIWLLITGLALVLGIVGLVGCGPASTTVEAINVSNQQQGIWVAGEGKVSVVPDVVTLRLGIEAQEASIAEAQSKGTEAMNRVMDALTDNGVAEKDIQTQYFRIRQVTRWDDVKQEEVVVGYRVTNMVTAKIRDIDKVGPIIDAVAAAGGDLTRIDSIDFSVDDPSEYYEEARQEAMADAEAKAKHLATLAGVTLGLPTYISEGVQVPPTVYPRVVYEAAPAPAPAPAPAISPGEMEISLTLQVAYAILD